MPWSEANNKKEEDHIKVVCARYTRMQPGPCVITPRRWFLEDRNMARGKGFADSAAKQALRHKHHVLRCGPSARLFVPFPSLSVQQTVSLSCCICTLFRQRPGIGKRDRPSYRLFLVCDARNFHPFSLTTWVSLRFSTRSCDHENFAICVYLAKLMSSSCPAPLSRSAC